MAEYTSLPWKVFTTTDGRKLVGIGAQSGEGILDCGFGVWAWDDAAGIANANLVVKAVNNHAALVNALTVAAERLEARGHNMGAREVWRVLADLEGTAPLSLSGVGSETERGK